MEKQSEKPGLAFGAYLQFLMDDRKVTLKQLARVCGKSEEFLGYILEGSIVPGKGTAVRIINHFSPSLWTRLSFWAFAGDEMALNEVWKAWDKAELASKAYPDPPYEPEAVDDESLAEARKMLLSVLQFLIIDLVQRLRFCFNLRRSVKRKRGRPRSKPEQTEPKIPKKRGRKPKIKNENPEPTPVIAPESRSKAADVLEKMQFLCPEEKEIALILLGMEESARNIQDTPLGPRKKPTPDPPPKKKQIPDEEYTPPPRGWGRLYKGVSRRLPINGTGEAVISKTDEFDSGDEASLYRYFACSNYDNCLTEAAEKRWPGFACFKCPFFQDPEMNADRDSRPVETTDYDATVC